MPLKEAEKRERSNRWNQFSYEIKLLLLEVGAQIYGVFNSGANANLSMEQGVHIAEQLRDRIIRAFEHQHKCNMQQTHIRVLLTVAAMYWAVNSKSDSSSSALDNAVNKAFELSC
jgi:hypothetical protein